MTNLEVQEKDGKIFCPLKNKWLITKPEEKVRQKFITILVNEYGYSLDQMAQEVELTGSKRGKGHAFADIVIWKSKADKDAMKDAFIIIETKAENVKLHVEDYYQGSNYAKYGGADFFVASNEKETKFFTVVRGYIPRDLEEIVSIPNAKEVDDTKKLDHLKNQTKTLLEKSLQKHFKLAITSLETMINFLLKLHLMKSVSFYL